MDLSFCPLHPHPVSRLHSPTPISPGVLHCPWAFGVKHPWTRSLPGLCALFFLF